jgi:hypothetical protein
VLEILRRERDHGNPWRPGRVVLTAPRVVVGDLALGQVAEGSFRLVPDGWVEVQDDELLPELERRIGELEAERRKLGAGTGSRESDAEYAYRVHELPARLEVLRRARDLRQDVTRELFRVDQVLRIEVLREALEPRTGADLFGEEVH